MSSPMYNYINKAAAVSIMSGASYFAAPFVPYIKANPVNALSGSIIAGLFGIAVHSKLEQETIQEIKIPLYSACGLLGYFGSSHLACFAEPVLNSLASLLPNCI